MFEMTHQVALTILLIQVHDFSHSRWECEAQNPTLGPKSRTGPTIPILDFFDCTRTLTNLAIYMFENTHSLTVITVSTSNLDNLRTSSRTKKIFNVLKSTKIQFKCANIHSKWPSSYQCKTVNAQATEQ